MDFDDCSNSSYSAGLYADVFSDESSYGLDEIGDALTDPSSLFSNDYPVDCADILSPIHSAPPSAIFSQGSTDFDDDRLTIPNKVSINAYSKNNNPYHRKGFDTTSLSADPTIWDSSLMVPPPSHTNYDHGYSQVKHEPPLLSDIFEDDLFGNPTPTYYQQPPVSVARAVMPSPPQIVVPQVTARQQPWNELETAPKVSPVGIAFPHHIRRSLPLLKLQDGVRKKNAKFAIPMGRNLENIDKLISDSKDEKEVKELKQQKRLLRNRQAALDSRQRKKAHTEDLEGKERQYQAKIKDLSIQLEQCQMRESSTRHENIRLRAELERQTEINQQLRITSHRKIWALTQEKRDLEEQALQLMTPSDSPLLEPIQAVKPTPAEKRKSDQEDASELQIAKRYASPVDSQLGTLAAMNLPAEDGMLLMILMCGAYVASRSDPYGNTPLSNVTDSVRVAALKLLLDLFNNAQVTKLLDRFPVASSFLRSPEFERRNLSDSMDTVVPLPTWMGGQSESILGDTDVDPDSLGLSERQYEELTTLGFEEHTHRVRSEKRQELERMVIADRSSQPASFSKHYANALRHDTLSDEVILQFARIVQEPDSQDGSSNVSSVVDG